MPISENTTQIRSTDFSPYHEGLVVVPSDSTVVSFRGFYVGGVGDVVIQPMGQAASVKLENVLAGVIYPIAISKVLATATTATLIVGLR